MGRSILAAVAGYIVMAVTVILGIVIAWQVFGPTGAFVGESTTPTTAWLVSNLVFGLLSAIVGGTVAVKIDRSDNQRAVRILCGIILVLGVGLAVAGIGAEPKPLPEGTSVAELSFTEAGEIASPPTWYNFVMPVVGALGVLAGSWICSRPARAADCPGTR